MTAVGAEIEFARTGRGRCRALPVRAIAAGLVFGTRPRCMDAPSIGPIVFAVSLPERTG
jgi:hypothetical protein